MQTEFDIRTYGAVGDGVTDDTEAIRAAFADAAKCGGTVLVPPGRYITGRQKMERGMRLEGRAAWSLKHAGGSVFLLREGEQDCMIDITGAEGAHIVGMSLVGLRLGERVHGIKLEWEKYNGGGVEDMPVIENCFIQEFSGDGIHLKHIWCFYLRHCHIHHNMGAGLYMDGWDAIIHDNWINGCSYGILMEPTGASGSIVGNRIVWCRHGGLRIASGNSWNVDSNFFDRCYGPAIWLGGEKSVRDMTVTGNMVRRSGKPDGVEFDSPYESSHFFFENCSNLSVQGNVFVIGKDDGGKGVYSPDYGIVMKNCQACLVTSNVLNRGSLKQNLVTENSDTVVLRDNIGRSIEEMGGME